MRVLSLYLFVFCLGTTAFSQKWVEYRQEILLMGCSFEFTIVDQDSVLCRTALAEAIAEVTRIENLVSSWKATSETSKVNRHAGKGNIRIDAELYQLIARSKKVSTLTGDAFSICFGAVYHLYDFKKSILALPPIDSLAYYKTLTLSSNIGLEEDNCVILTAFSKIGFGAIAKGYAADRVKEKLKALGVQNACINASGDLTVWGKNIEGKAWSIGITDPINKAAILLKLNLENTSIVTSGDYENYFETADGTRYSHIIDPRTCLPVTNRLSVSVISPSTEFSDALATAICVMGVEKGLTLVNKLKGVEVVIIDQNHEVYFSDHLDHD